ncbi:lonely Cys domain-containing protein [Streptomyces sp. NPDC048279]|uniref:lonely Cys domain-containing protein n=1 Tax=Streptomyces sp. NPDC048279 TaxID=3154714 RepID=UPI003420D1EC
MGIAEHADDPAAPQRRSATVSTVSTGRQPAPAPEGEQPGETALPEGSVRLSGGRGIGAVTANGLSALAYADGPPGFELGALATSSNSPFMSGEAFADALNDVSRIPGPDGRSGGRNWLTVQVTGVIPDSVRVYEQYGTGRPGLTSATVPAGWYRPGGPVPYVVAAEGGPDHVFVPGLGGLPVALSAASFAEVLARDSDLAVLGRDVPVVLVVPDAGGEGLDLPRTVALRLGRTVWAASGEARLFRDGTRPEHVIALVDRDPGLPLGRWIASRPDGPGPAAEDGVVTALDGRVFRDSDIHTRTIVTADGRPAGRRAVYDDRQDREDEETDADLTQMTRIHHVLPGPFDAEVAAENLSLNRSALYHFAAGAQPGLVEVRLKDGRVLDVSGSEIGNMLARRPSLEDLPSHAGIFMNSNWAGAATDEPGRPLQEHSPDPVVADPLAIVPVGQHVANRTGRQVVCPTRVVGYLKESNRYSPLLVTTPWGGRGRLMTFMPEPAGNELVVLAREAGLYTSPSRFAPHAVLHRTLRLVRALRATFGIQVEADEHVPGGYLELLRGIGALEAMRDADPLLGPVTPFTLDLFREVARSFQQQGDPDQTAYRTVLASARAAMDADNGAVLRSFTPLPRLAAVAQRLDRENVTELTAEILRLKPADPIGKEERTRLYWALVKADEVMRGTPDVAALAAKVLHTPPAPHLPDEAFEDLSRLVAKAVAAGLDAANPSVLAAYDLELRGAFAESTTIVGAGRVVRGRTWGGPMPQWLDCTFMYEGGAGPGGAVTLERRAQAPWPASPAPWTIRIDADDVSGMLIRGADGSAVPVPQDEFVELLKRDQDLADVPLDAPVVLLSGPAAPSWANAVSKALGRTVWFHTMRVSVREHPSDPSSLLLHSERPSMPTDGWYQQSPGGDLRHRPCAELVWEAALPTISPDTAGAPWSVRSWKPAGSPDRVRFAYFYHEQGWRQLSTSWELALAHRLTRRPGATRAAQDAVRRLLPPEAGQTASGSTVEQLLALAPGPVALDELMVALTYAAYATELPLEVRQVLEKEPDPKANHPDRGRYRGRNPYREVHDERGFRRVAGTNGPALRLLRLYADSGASPEQLRDFRLALVAWLVPADLQSLHEILRASHKVGMGDVAERTVVRQDGARLHVWAHEFLENWGATKDLYPLPHQKMYARVSTVDEDSMPPLKDILEALAAAKDSTLNSLPRDLRVVLMTEWLANHGAAGLAALRRLTPAHIIALHLYSGPDYSMIKVLLAGERVGQAMVRYMFRRAIRATVSNLSDIYLSADELSQSENSDELVWLENYRFPPPLTLLNDPAFNAIYFGLTKIRKDGGTNDELLQSHAALDALADRVRVNLATHIDMAIEALEILPPANRKVWWGDRRVPGQLLRPEPDTPIYRADKIARPFFRSTSAIHRVAAYFALSNRERPSGTHPAVVNIDNSSGRDISPFALHSRESEVLYPPGSDGFDVLGRRRARGPGGRYFEDITAKEESVPGSDAGPSRAESATTIKSRDTEATKRRSISFYPMISGGTLIGFASFNDYEWEVRSTAYADLGETGDFFSWEKAPRLHGARKPLPSGGIPGGTIYFASHGGEQGLRLSDLEGGTVHDDGSLAAHALITTKGFKSVTMLSSAAPDPERTRACARRIMQACNVPVFFATGQVSVHSPEDQHSTINLLEDDQGRATAWEVVRPSQEDRVAGPMSDVGHRSARYQRTGPYSGDLDGTALTLRRSPVAGDPIAGPLLLALRRATVRTLPKKSGTATAQDFAAWLARRLSDTSLPEGDPPLIPDGLALPLSLLVASGVTLTPGHHAQATLCGGTLPVSDLVLNRVDRVRVLVLCQSYGPRDLTTVVWAAQVLASVAARELRVGVTLVGPGGDVSHFGGGSPRVFLVLDGDRYLMAEPVPAGLTGSA